MHNNPWLVIGWTVLGVHLASEVNTNLALAQREPSTRADVQKPPASPTGRPKTDKKLSDRDLVEKLEAYVGKLTRADAFSGTYLLAKDGTLLCKGAFRLASKRFDVRNNVDTKFNLGSMNKMFTGVAVAQLAQRGKLTFDDPISKYLSTDWLPREISDKVTIHHLLTHTSGLGSYFTQEFMNSSRMLYRQVDDYKPIVSKETLAFEPGTKWSYSNTGMLLAGAVVEKVTGRSYYHYVRENIYKPAGMTNTDCYQMDRPVPNLAIGYTEEYVGGGAEWINNLYLHVIRGGPAGGGFSTVGDLLRFDQALRSHKLLNPEYTKIVLTAKPETNSPDYGYGFSVGGEPGNRRVGHGGGAPGINANLDMFLDSGYTAAVMSNYDHGARPVRNKIRKLLELAKESPP
ncbi:MAG: serine hydrolase domain-containing protein [Planctomycetota bacterium]|jgi:CubicO group peptidase (beta-lactamase class C family)